jgi:ribosome-binding protein aMBF1 (putative translation factor)
MHIHAKLEKSGKHWLIEFPFLDIVTQASNKRGLVTMATSLLNDTIDRDLGLTVVAKAENLLTLHTSDTRGYLALVIHCRRQMLGMTQAELATKIGAKSATAVARYEQCKTSPSLEVLEKLLAGVGVGLSLSLELNQITTSRQKD